MIRRRGRDSINDIEKEKLLKMSEISIVLDTYDDIFSDFDPRPYIYRALSDDFLIEIKKAVRDKPSGIIELKLLMPSDKRKLDQENLVKRRLRDHFKKHYLQMINEVGYIKRKAIGMIILGIALMICAAFVSYYFLENGKFISHLLIVLLEPAGWFIFWTGLDQIFYEIKDKKPGLDFYEKMSQAEIWFYDY